MRIVLGRVNEAPGCEVDQRKSNDVATGAELKAKTDTSGGRRHIAHAVCGKGTADVVAGCKCVRCDVEPWSGVHIHHIPSQCGRQPCRPAWEDAFIFTLST